MSDTGSFSTLGNAESDAAQGELDTLSVGTPAGARKAGARQAGARVNRAVEKTAERVTERVATASERVAETVASASEKTRSVVDRAAAQVQNVTDRFEPLASERPYATLGAGIVIGLFLGLLLGAQRPKVIYLKSRD